MQLRIPLQHHSEPCQCRQGGFSRSALRPWAEVLPQRESRRNKPQESKNTLRLGSDAAAEAFQELQTQTCFPPYIPGPRLAAWFMPVLTLGNKPQNRADHTNKLMPLRRKGRQKHPTDISEAAEYGITRLWDKHGVGKDLQHPYLELCLLWNAKHAKDME